MTVPLRFCRWLRIAAWCAVILVAAAVLTTAALYAVPRIDRAWQSLEFDPSWEKDVERRQIADVMAFVRGEEGTWKGGAEWWRKWVRNKEVEDAYARLERLGGVSAVGLRALRVFSSAGDEFVVWLAARDTERMIGRTAATGNVRLHDAWNQSLLTLALALGKDELACSLVKRGADVNLRVVMPENGGQGDTPLSWAASIDKMDGSRSDFDRSRNLVSMLLEHGADIHAPGAAGLPLFVYGFFGLMDEDPETRRGGEDFILWLLERGAPYQAVLPDTGVLHLAELAASFPSLRLEQALAARGVDWKELPEGVNPLAALNAESKGAEEVAAFLFAQGVDADAVDKAGYTALARQCEKLAHADGDEEAERTTAFIAELVQYGSDCAFGKMTPEKRREVRAALRGMPVETKARLFAAAPELALEG